RVVDLPHLGTLVFRIPAVLCVTEGKDALLGARFFFVAAGTAERSIELVLVERLPQGDRLHHMGMDVRPVAERSDSLAHAILIDMDEEFKTLLTGLSIAKFDHLAEFPCRIDMQKGKGWRSRIECLHRQMQHH